MAYELFAHVYIFKLLIIIISFEGGGRVDRFPGVRTRCQGGASCTTTRFLLRVSESTNRRLEALPN